MFIWKLLELLVIFSRGQNEEFVPVGDKNDKCEVLVPGMAQNRFPTSAMLLERCGNEPHWVREEDL